jgi:hypothetical protein
MSHAPLHGSAPDIGSLFKAESVLVPEPEAVRRRILDRARAAVSRGIFPGRAADARPLRGLSLGKAAAAIVLFVGLTAAAYELGYRRSKVTTEAIVPSVAPAPLPATVPTPAETTALIESLPEPVPPPPRRPTRSRPLPAAAPASEGDAYASELRLLRPAQMALGQSSFANALALVDEHQRRFPSGHLAEEREALRVKALLGLDRREEARRATAAFRVHFPNSALLARIQAMSGTAP